ncbi:MAG: MFS transporter [Thaumarchaeota archaeon]|nr:MFS transporter [Nitrososphaerota archaeon]
MTRGNSTIPPWLTRNVALLSFSAFFADMGYQAVTAVFPLLLIIKMHEPAYLYGLILALSYGLGSAVSLLGGRLGDKYGKKTISIIGNLFIPLMSVAALFQNIWLVGALFVLGWWARYFRSPARRAWLVDISSPGHRTKVFGFLHSLDVGGGIVAVAYTSLLVYLKVPFSEIMLVTIAPLLVSSACLVPASQRPEGAALRQETETEGTSSIISGRDGFVLRALLISATLFGFSFYALGFPIITVAESQSSPVLGILTFGIFLGASSLAGYLLGVFHGRRPVRTLWTLGYLLAAASSLAIGLAYLFHLDLWLYYLGAAGLGFATGSVETFEPVLVSFLVRAKKLSSGMGWLSSSRALGLFVSNLAMGILFVFSQFDSYTYAALSACFAAVILSVADLRKARPGKDPA